MTTFDKDKKHDEAQTIVTNKQKITNKNYDFETMRIWPIVEMR